MHSIWILIKLNFATTVWTCPPKRRTRCNSKNTRLLPMISFMRFADFCIADLIWLSILICVLVIMYFGQIWAGTGGSIVCALLADKQAHCKVYYMELALFAAAPVTLSPSPPSLSLNIPKIKESSSTTYIFGWFIG